MTFNQQTTMHKENTIHLKMIECGPIPFHLAYFWYTHTHFIVCSTDCGYWNVSQTRTPYDRQYTARTILPKCDVRYFFAVWKLNPFCVRYVFAKVYIQIKIGLNYTSEQICKIDLAVGIVSTIKHPSPISYQQYEEIEVYEPQGFSVEDWRFIL